MLSLAKARKDYYLQKLGEISPREDYYLRGGTATGRWCGSGASALGLDGTVTAEGLVRLFDGQHPGTGEQLGRRLRKDGVAAWDLTFSADKSVSLLWAFGDDEVRRHVIEAFEEATAEAVAYLESVASSTRGARRVPVLDDDGNPVLNPDGTPKMRVETWPIPTEGYVAAWFTEFTSRADDPQLHTHVVVGNRVRGVDGVWRTIDGRLLYRHQLTAGYLHEAEVRSRLTRRLGVRWQPVINGMADIEGFTRDQIEAFSQRRQQIEAWRDAHDLPDTPAANEAATLATRTTKQDHSLDTLRERWMERGAEVGLTPNTVAALLNRSREVTALDPEPLYTDLASPKGLTERASTFGRADVIAAVAAALPEGGTRSEIEAAADTFLHHPDVVPLHPTRSDSAEERAFNGELEQPLENTEPSELEMRRRDGRLFPFHERRYTTAELLATEQRIIDRGLTSIAVERWTVPRDRVEAILAARRHLTDGQRTMVRRFATSGNGIDVGIGAAGTGKTTVMALIADLAVATDTPIIGTSLAARAAAGFQTATGIPSYTLARLLWETEVAGGLPQGAVVVVDEAGMVGTRQLAAVSDLVEAASGKLILIGDPHQLPEIDAGGLFRALAARLPTVELTENVRQHHHWERIALAELRNGSVDRAVAMYHRRHRITTAATPADTIDQAVANWYQDVEAIGDPAQVFLIGHRNTTVDELNRRARDRIADAGLLHGPALTAGDREFRVGDRVVCLKNKPRLGVLNGDLATIIAIDPERRTLSIRLDRTGQTVAVPHWYLDDRHLDWGYALTGHKAQGATARRTHTLLDGSVDRQWTYVTMSRGQEANTIYLAEPDMSHEECEHLAHQRPDRLAVLTALGRSDAELAAVDIGRGLPPSTDGQSVESRDLGVGGHPESSRHCPHGRTMPNRDVKQFLRRRIGRGEWRDGRGPSRALSR